MLKKLKFNKPMITRIKLDPEQAVLAECMVSGSYYGYEVLEGIKPCYDVSTARAATACPVAKRSQSPVKKGTATNSAAGS